jgi:KaiC/GvpD/RAD55 family RecA-like ATPase
MLEDLMTQPIGTGDVFATANTIILMGRTRQEGRLGRALSIPKHRGSACSDEIMPYSITDEGLVLG